MHCLQVTPQRVQLCGLHAVHAGSSAEASSAPATAEGAPGMWGSNNKRHASWSHLPGMEERISEALARQRFLRPR